MRGLARRSCARCSRNAASACAGLGAAAARHASAQRSAVRSTTRAMKSISSWPMSGEKALGARRRRRRARRRAPARRSTAAPAPRCRRLGRRRRRGPSAVGTTPSRAGCPSPSVRSTWPSTSTRQPGGTPLGAFQRDHRRGETEALARQIVDLQAPGRRGSARRSARAPRRGCAPAPRNWPRAVASRRWRTPLSWRCAPGDARQRRRAEVDDVGGVGPHAQRLHQVRIVTQEVGSALQEGADRLVPRQLVRILERRTSVTSRPPPSKCDRPVPGRPS